MMPNYPVITLTKPGDQGVSWWQINYGEFPITRQVLKGNSSEAHAYQQNVDPLGTGELTGPYKSETDAQNGKNSTPAPTNPAAPGAPSPNPPNPFAGLAGIANALAKIGAVFDSVGRAVTDGKMWRSLGWVVLGILLMLGATILWGRSALTGQVTKLARGVAGGGE